MLLRKTTVISELNDILTHPINNSHRCAYTFITTATEPQCMCTYTYSRSEKKKQFLKALDGKLWPGGLKKDWLLLRHKIDTFLSLRLGAP